MSAIEHLSRVLAETNSPIPVEGFGSALWLLNFDEISVRILSKAAPAAPKRLLRWS